MKKEIYCSFDGKLEIGGPEAGYMIYDVGNGMLQYESIALGTTERERARIPAKLLPPEDYGNIDKIAELVVDAWYGRRDGLLCWYHGKWWSADAIDQIRRKHDDMWWQRYV